MTSREIIQRTLAFDNPDRVGVSFGTPDMTFVGAQIPSPATEWREIGNEAWERIDEWGNIWRRVDPYSKGEVYRGVIERAEDIDTHTFPDCSKPEYYTHIEKVRKDFPDTYLVGGVPGFAFNIARKLRKIDLYFIDLLEYPDRIQALHDRIDAMLADMIRNFARVGCDAMMITEDWGTQQELLIDPALWRTEFKPRYAKLCAGLCKENGLAVWLHSCGQTEAIIPDLMEAGVDLLQFDQPELHGIDRLASHQERGNITFWCPVDIQKTLQTRDEHRIRRAACEMLDKLWRGRGGFIAGFYGDNNSIGLTPEWQEYACDEFRKSGIRSRYI